MPDQPTIQLEGVIKDYGEGVVTRVLRGVSLSIEPGELAALIGPSGSGKSTLLNIMGLLDRPTDGRIVVDGIDTTAMSENEITHLRGRALGFVFQFHHLLRAFTALENVLMPAVIDRGRPDPAVTARGLELLGRVGLGDLADRKVTKLSGGQQQRVAVARALMLRPRLVLADEPTGNLDTESADEIFALFRKLNREERTAFLVVTHDARLAARCDRIIRLVDGRIVSDASNTAADDPCAVCGYGPRRDAGEGLPPSARPSARSGPGA
jgi:lipoprotein-releasing system ATP-binding protein